MVTGQRLCHDSAWSWLMTLGLCLQPLSGSQQVSHSFIGLLSVWSVEGHRLLWMSSFHAMLLGEPDTNLTLVMCGEAAATGRIILMLDMRHLYSFAVEDFELLTLRQNTSERPGTHTHVMGSLDLPGWPYISTGYPTLLHSQQLMHHTLYRDSYYRSAYFTRMQAPCSWDYVRAWSHGTRCRTEN